MLMVGTQGEILKKSQTPLYSSLSLRLVKRTGMGSAMMRIQADPIIDDS